MSLSPLTDTVVFPGAKLGIFEIEINVPFRWNILSFYAYIFLCVFLRNKDILLYNYRIIIKIRKIYTI